MNGNENIPNAELINENKTLYIYPINIKNEGTYTCLVKNVEGNASTTSNITVFGEFYYHLQSSGFLTVFSKNQFKPSPPTEFENVMLWGFF